MHNAARNFVRNIYKPAIQVHVLHGFEGPLQDGNSHLLHTGYQEKYHVSRCSDNTHILQVYMSQYQEKAYHTSNVRAYTADHHS